MRLINQANWKSENSLLSSVSRRNLRNAIFFILKMRKRRRGSYGWSEGRKNFLKKIRWARNLSGEPEARLRRPGDLILQSCCSGYRKSALSLVVHSRRIRIFLPSNRVSPAYSLEITYASFTVSGDMHNKRVYLHRAYGPSMENLRGGYNTFVFISASTTFSVTFISLPFFTGSDSSEFYSDHVWAKDRCLSSL